MRALLLGLTMVAAAQEWRFYGGDAGGSKYSPLAEIHKQNVQRLKPVWVFDTGDASDGKTYASRSAFETTPLMIDGVLYVASSFHRLFALDPDTGKLLWQFDSKFDPRTRVTLHFSRGVSYWTDGKQRRILLGDQQARLFSIDLATRKPDPGFGKEGVIDLRQGVADAYPRTMYAVTSPPAVCRDTVITGAAVGDGEPRGPAGDIRGFDVRTGRLKWRFHTVPRPGDFGHDTWAPGSWKDRTGVNAWTVLSADEKLGTVYVPLTSAATDFYGGDREGDNLFADSLVALDCQTGVRKWHFQTVHHNLWDYDLPAQPVLLKIRGVDAVAQITKTGFVFAFDRATGKPLFDIEERPVPASPIPGEKSSPTQPFPVKPPPFARQGMRPGELTTVTPDSRAECLEKIKGARISGSLYEPITEQPTVFFPGTNGGANWGGGSLDPSTSTLYVNSMDVGGLVKMIPRPNDAIVPFRNQGFGRFWDSNLYPCQEPPWGSLTAIDMNTGEFRWRVRLGEFDELTARGIPKTGTPNLGGSITTAGGLVFIAATNDGKFRAFDKDTGEELWVTRLPGSGHATPMTYRSPKTGRQFVVIAAGGGNKYNKEFGSKMVAFAVPRERDPAEAPLVKAPPRLRMEYTGAEEKLPVAVAPQPLAFSHRMHGKLSCITCHQTALKAARAGIPETSRCRTCHPEMPVQPVKWVRVYKVPDFVFFSHDKHAKVACAQCHGPVQTRDVLAKEVSTSMGACVQCHQQNKASTSCTICHDLGQ